MDRCVKRVAAQGHDKDAAIAICHASIVKRKERREARLARLATLKANYGAKVGETISGALARGQGGRFTRGDGSPMSGSELRAALTAKPKKGGKGKRGAPLSNEALESVGGSKADVDAITAFAKTGKLDSAAADRLISRGLAKRDEAGRLVVSSAARTYARAVNRGDAAAAVDALSRAEASAKPKPAKTPKAPKAPKAPKGAKPKKASDAEAKRAERAEQRKVDETRKVGARLEEIEALVKQDTNVTEFERTRNINRLDELSVRLERVGGDEALTKRINDARKALAMGAGAGATKKARDSFAVFKQADGRYRWLAVTSNSYRDRDGEIVTQKALEADAERMTTSGEYGPLRFWHVGKVEYSTPLDWTTAKAGPGLDIGTCDFSVMHGRFAVEGGEVYPQFGPGLAANDWQVSRGFSHPMGHPVARAYDEIRTFERSPLPMGAASNPFTSLAITEGESMANLEDKMKEFAAKFFGGDVTKAKAYADDLTKTDKEIEAKGIAFKEDEAATATAEAAPDATTEAKAEGAAETDADADAMFVGDMMADEFASLLTKSISEALAPMLTAQAELGKRIEAAETATKEMREVDRATHEAVTSVLKGFVTTKETTDKSMAAIDARVKELEGNAPGQKGFRASADASTVTTKQATAPQTPDDLSRMAAFLFGTQVEQGA